ncbi:hypothetical protein [Dialister micraerophilus]|uniref:hypothetical protein n=1 Tax=Dialister micraerophilus TaxID=309120 RepID=UPI0023F03ABD|nr:hypothetical protein [Dialister micraerophilus]
MSTEMVIAIFIWLAFVFVNGYIKKNKNSENKEKESYEIKNYDYEKARNIIKKSWDKISEQKQEEKNIYNFVEKDKFKEEKRNYVNLQILNNNEINSHKNKKINLKKWIVYDSIFNEPRSKRPFIAQKRVER